MKYLVIVIVAFVFAQGKKMPDYLSDLVCHKSDPELQECLRDNVAKAFPKLLEGVPELNLPPLEPWELPLVTVDRTINELVSVKSVLRNVKFSGFSNIILDYFKADPKTLSAELRYTLPWSHLEMDYEVEGQLLIVPLRSKGFMSGNFTDTQIYMKGSLKYVDKDGEPYFRVDKLYFKGRVGDGHVKLESANPQLQFAADLIANFYNEQPRLVMDALNPIFAETSTDVFRIILDQVLGSIPANELLPE